MGFFDRIGDIIKVADKVVKNVDNIIEIKEKGELSDNFICLGIKQSLLG